MEEYKELLCMKKEIKNIIDKIENDKKNLPAKFKSLSTCDRTIECTMNCILPLTIGCVRCLRNIYKNNYYTKIIYNMLIKGEIPKFNYKMFNELYGYNTYVLCCVGYYIIKNKININIE